MKRINNKGFTLVELLAVIIILAIVVGITIPAVLTMVDSAREKAGKDAAAIAADWVDKQYSLRIIGFGGGDTVFNECFPTSGSKCTDSAGVDVSADFIRAAGLTPNDVATMNVKILSNDRACVTVTASSAGNFYINRTGEGINVYQSVNCTS